MKTKKILALAIAAVLLVAVSVAGTVAYLTSTTQKVTNEFQPTKVDVAIDEHEYIFSSNTLATTFVGEGNTEDTYKLIPGLTMPKDPHVTVPAGGESVYVYIKVTKENEFDTYITANVNTNVWSEVSGTDDVWYLTAGPVGNGGAAAGPFYILSTSTTNPYGEVTVKPEVGGTVDMPAVGSEPKIAFEAFVIQSATFADANAAYQAVYGTN